MTEIFGAEAIGVPAPVGYDSGGSFGASSGASPGTTEATDLLESVNIGGVQIEFVGGSLDGSSEGAQPGRPVSFKPPNFSG